MTPVVSSACARSRKLAPPPLLQRPVSAARGWTRKKSGRCSRGWRGPGGLSPPIAMPFHPGLLREPRRPSQPRIRSRGEVLRTDKILHSFPLGCANERASKRWRHFFFFFFRWAALTAKCVLHKRSPASGQGVRMLARSKCERRRRKLRFGGGA